MEQDNVLKLLFDCAVSAAAPQASICSSSDSAVLVPVLLEFFLSAFTSPIDFLRGGGVFVFFLKQAFFNSAFRTSVLYIILSDTGWRKYIFFLECG